jgi:diguanylate cyclase (GGDEF)-like protein
MKDTLPFRKCALRVFLLALFVMSCVCPRARAQQYTFQYFGVEQGLTNLAVKTLFQDRTGFIWVVTENGVFRYEGVRFREFTPEQGLQASITASIGESPDGSVLVGNQFGLFQLRGEKFQRVPLREDARINGYNSILLDGNRTWIGTDKGLLYITAAEGNLEVHPGPALPTGIANNVQSVFVARNGQLWWGCNLSLCTSANNRSKVLSEASGVNPFRVQAILCDREGNMWITQNRRVMVRKAGAERFEDADPSLPPTGPGSTPRIDSDGRLLVPTTEGLAIRQGGRFHVRGRLAGLLPPVYSVLQDREGSVWLGLGGRGLAKWLGYSEWESFSAQSGLSGETVYEVLPAKDGKVWVGTEAGFFRGQRGEFGWTWHLVQAFGKVPVHAVQQSADGNLWLGTDGRGVARFDPRTQAVKWFGRPAGLNANSPNAILVDHNQDIWAGTENGIFISEHSSGRFRQVPDVPAERCLALIQTPGGDIWAGTRTGVLLRHHNQWRKFGLNEGLRSEAVVSLAFEPDKPNSGAATSPSYGTLWLGYRLNGSITRLRFENGSPDGKPLMTHFNSPAGKAVNITYFLGFDANQRLWAGTNLGVQVLDTTSNHWDRYDHRDGLVWDDCDLHSFAAEPDGHVWIGTSGGLSRFLPRTNPVQSGPPRTVFTSVRTGNTSIDPSSELTLGYSSVPLVAGFTALRFGRDRDVVFRYRLTPIVPAWKETQDRELQFPALPPGDYQLDVQGRDSKSRWSESSATFRFHVLAPWWRTWWFIGACVLIAFLCGAFLLRRRTSREVAIRHELENAVAERTRELSHQYRHDVLTGLPNRLLFGERLSRELLTAERKGTLVAVLFIDLDRFKRINDTWGHQTGDEFLKQIAERLRSCLLESETIARIGGDEFIVLIPGLPDKKEAENRGWALMRALKAPIRIEGKNVFATMSVGIALFPNDGRDSGALMAAADTAMYRAKASGKNQVRLFEAGMTEAASRPQNIEDRLRDALKHGGFQLCYQPQYTIDGKLEGFEALLRVKGSEHELPPAEFIPIAEESGLIVEIGAWVLEEACRQARLWHDAGFPETRISVNVSVMQLSHPGFEEHLLHVIGKTGIDPARLELELTETALVKDTGGSADLLNRMRARGIKVALDDFGTGYSPMQYLHELPVDVVKIDQVFVRDLAATPSSVPLVEGMVKLAKTLSLRVVAEGVESQSQLEIVRQIGFDVVQGSLMSLPVTPAQAELLLRRGAIVNV